MMHRPIIIDATIIPVLHKPAYRLPQGTGGGVQVVKTYLATNGGGRSAPI